MIEEDELDDKKSTLLPDWLGLLGGTVAGTALGARAGIEVVERVPEEAGLTDSGVETLLGYGAEAAFAGIGAAAGYILSDKKSEKGMIYGLATMPVLFNVIDYYSDQSDLTVATAGESVTDTLVTIG